MWLSRAGERVPPLGLVVVLCGADGIWGAVVGSVDGWWAVQDIQVQHMWPCRKVLLHCWEAAALHRTLCSIAVHNASMWCYNLLLT